MTTVPVDKNYNFPRTELEAMTYEIAGMIEDIGRMDDYRRNMMDELKVLRDVTLFYNERYPELRSAVRRSCLLYTSPSPRDGLLSRMPSSA